MKRKQLEILRRFIDKALSGGWNPCDGGIQGTFVINDPPCVRISVASPSRLVDRDVYVDWLGPLHDTELAQAVWGTSLVHNQQYGYQAAWRLKQHELLDVYQIAGVDAYFDFLELTQ